MRSERNSLSDNKSSHRLGAVSFASRELSRDLAYSRYFGFCGMADTVASVSVRPKSFTMITTKRSMDSLQPVYPRIMS